MTEVSFAPVEGRGNLSGSETAHALLARLTARHWPRIPQPLVLQQTKKGKPYFPDFPHCYFNLSHSGEWVVCALSDSPIGVDIQQHRPHRAETARKFTPEEQAWLQLHPQDFFAVWCKKEAFLKATGDGLTRRLDSFSVLPLQESITEGYRVTLLSPPAQGYSVAMARWAGSEEGS